MTMPVMRLLPRHAENFYWLGRYGERAVCRSSLLERMQTLLPPNHALLRHLPAGFIDEAAFAEARQDNPALTALAFYRQSALHGVPGMITAARENARSIRALIPQAVWEVINRLALTPKTGEQRDYHRLRDDLAAYDGLAERHMIRGDGWVFWRLGKALERADQVMTMASLCDRHADATLFGQLFDIPPGATPCYDWLADADMPLSPVCLLDEAKQLLKRLPNAPTGAIASIGTERLTPPTIWLAEAGRIFTDAHHGIIRYLERHAIGAA